MTLAEGRDPAANAKAARAALAGDPFEAGDLSGFLWNLGHYDGEPKTRHAKKFVMHTFVRTNELRFGTWSEIEGDQWRIPGIRMKMGRNHIVPLTRQSLAILAKLKAIAGGSEWIVPGGRSGKPISENTMLFGRHRLGYHGRARACLG